MRVSAVIPYRGDVSLNPILNYLRECPSVREVLVYNNGEGQIEHYVHDGSPHGLLHIIGGGWSPKLLDLAVYARYAAIQHAREGIIYVQDDDCLIEAEAIVARYEPGRLVANMPASRWADYPDSTMVGWGAVFDRDLPSLAWARFSSTPDRFTITTENDLNEKFLRTADVVFSSLVPRTVIDVGFQHLPWAEDPARAMFKQPGHKDERDEILALCRGLRSGPDDDRRG